MMKMIAPWWQQLRHLPSPRMFAVPKAQADKLTIGQRLAEHVANFVGSWPFLTGQAGFLFLWLVYNTLQITSHFDPPPYILLNLLLSFQAAFTGPVLLIAANVGAARDHAQANRIEQLVAQNEKLAEQNCQLVERMVTLEQMLDTHMASSFRAHTAELRDLGMMVRAMHAQILPRTPVPASTLDLLDGESVDGATAPEPATVAAAAPAKATAKARRR